MDRRWPSAMNLFISTLQHGVKMDLVAWNAMISTLKAYPVYPKAPFEEQGIWRDGRKWSWTFSPLYHKERNLVPFFAQFCVAERVRWCRCWVTGCWRCCFGCFGCCLGRTIHHKTFALNPNMVLGFRQLYFLRVGYRDSHEIWWTEGWKKRWRLKWANLSKFMQNFGLTRLELTDSVFSFILLSIILCRWRPATPYLICFFSTAVGSGQQPYL